MLTKVITAVQSYVYTFCLQLGSFGMFFLHAMYAIVCLRTKFRKFIDALFFMGNKSVGVVALIGTTAGAVLALQSYIGLHRFNAEQFIGPIVFVAMVRELGPIFTAIMVIGRAGSAITAEIGTMQVTEQIDALKTLSINVQGYLVSPRILAGIIVLPLLSLFCSICGIYAGYLVATMMLDINSELYIKSIQEAVDFSDISAGLIKSVFFGLLIASISCYKGYMTSGGSKGVGMSTTQSVVYSNVTIFIANYVMTSLWLS